MRISARLRILEAATANAWSETNLQIQNLMFSGAEFASPSAVLNRVCNTSPPKLWHSLSNICDRGTESSIYKFLARFCETKVQIDQEIQENHLFQFITGDIESVCGQWKIILPPERQSVIFFQVNVGQPSLTGAYQVAQQTINFKFMVTIFC